MESKLLIAHRGASAHAPEHTAEAYELAIAQGADFIEPDLQMTRDGVLVALHDSTLERTTDVRHVFPDRARDQGAGSPATPSWHVRDFTLTEIKRLDAGSWFGNRFRGARIPTLAEVIEIADGRAGIFPEVKAPDRLGLGGLTEARRLLAELERHGLQLRHRRDSTPVMIQSFSRRILRALRRRAGATYPLILLIGSRRTPGASRATERWLAAAGALADGLGPNKEILSKSPGWVDRAHDAGLTVLPYTFGRAAPPGFDDVTHEMAHFLYDLGVDGLFTDDPAGFPRRPSV